MRNTATRSSLDVYGGTNGVDETTPLEVSQTSEICILLVILGNKLLIALLTFHSSLSNAAGLIRFIGCFLGGDEKFIETT